MRYASPSSSCSVKLLVFRIPYLKKKERNKVERGRDQETLFVLVSEHIGIIRRSGTAEENHKFSFEIFRIFFCVILSQQISTVCKI